MPYRAELAPAAQRQLRRLPAVARSRLAAPILDLARSPRPPGARKEGRGASGSVHTVSCTTSTTKRG